MPLLSIVAPFYNEEAAVETFCRRVRAAADAVHDLQMEVEIICVNDGSRDATWPMLLAAARADARFRVIDLSRNFGKEAALTAGLQEARGDAVVPIDADLQDPPELIPELVARWREGFEVVLARRTARDGDGYWKRLGSRLFYRLHNRLADTPLPDDVGDFRLLDRKVVDALLLLPERRRFLKGMFAWLGFSTTSVDYVRGARSSGASKFTLRGLVDFGLDGMLSFSTAPLRFWIYCGVAIAGLAFLYASFIVVRTLVQGVDVPGYASLIVISLFLGGIQLLGIGVIGEYVGRIYGEVKQRPLYLVRERFPDDGAAPHQAGPRTGSPVSGDKSIPGNS
ncbi:MAG: glycosyltransferase family 2 protein [Burkholderiales bacterium]|nr:glycosyltransferase family 2 protein [Burkholderiales bacterium]